MDVIPLGTTGRNTTRLGFGTSTIMSAITRRQSLALLETAYDAGVRHFDTAPMYGDGLAEGCLGEFLSRHPGEITITTKFGIPPLASRSLVRAARIAANAVLLRVPKLKRRLQKAIAPMPSMEPEQTGSKSANPIFTVSEARASLEKSLRELRVERIDVWLLHEVRAQDLPTDASNDPLLRYMEAAVQEGKIGTFGVGSGSQSVRGLLERCPAYCRVTQYEWSASDPPVPASASFRIHHRALGENFPKLLTMLQEHQTLRGEWSSVVGRELTATTVGQLMLRAAVLANEASVILFSSKNPKHIATNVAAVEDASLQEPAMRLTQLIRDKFPAASI